MSDRKVKEEKSSDHLPYLLRRPHALEHWRFMFLDKHSFRSQHPEHKTYTIILKNQYNAIPKMAFTFDTINDFHVMHTYSEENI